MKSRNTNIVLQMKIVGANGVKPMLQIRLKTLLAINHRLINKMLKILKPIYENLSTNNLLKRCLKAETQNNNESLN